MNRKIHGRLVQLIEAGFLTEQFILLDRGCQPDERWRKFHDSPDFQVQREGWNAVNGLRAQAQAAGVLSADNSRQLERLLVNFPTLPSAQRHTVSRIFNYLAHVRKFIGFKPVADADSTSATGGTRTQGWFSGHASEVVLPRSAWTMKEGGPGWGRS